MVLLDIIRVGNQIASLRKKRGFTQEELSERLGITAQAISKWENGHSLPETALLPMLSDILDCSIDQILMPTLAQDRAFKAFADAIGGEAGELAMRLYREMKQRFDFALEFRDKFYVFDSATDGQSAIFKNPKKDDFLIRIDAAAEADRACARLSLTNCAQYIHKIERMPEHIKRAFRCTDCNGCTCACPYLMAYTFEGADYQQCHFITISLDSPENLALILELVSAEQAT